MDGLRPGLRADARLEHGQREPRRLPCRGWRRSGPRRRGRRPRPRPRSVTDWSATSTVTVPSWTCSSSWVPVAWASLTWLVAGARVQSHSSTTSGGSVPATSTPRPPASPAPQDGALTRAGDLHGLRLGRLDQGRQPDPERVADPQQRPHARVRRALLDVDHHPPAHPGRLRQPVQRPPPRLPLLFDPDADRRRQGSGSSSMSAA